MKSLDELAGQLRETGLILEKKHEKAQLLDYRNKLSEFMDFFLKKSYSLEQNREMRLDSSKSPPFNAVETVREILSLESEDTEIILKKILQNEKDCITVLEKNGLLSGLLLNMKR